MTQLIAQGVNLDGVTDPEELLSKTHDQMLGLQKEQMDELNAECVRRLWPQIFPIFLPHFRLYEVVSLHACVLPYKCRKILEMLLKLMKLCRYAVKYWKCCSN